MRVRVAHQSASFIDLAPMDTDVSRADRVSSEGMHILVDLTSHTYGGRIAIAARRPAAVVINYLGFPGTSGCAGFHYSAVDARVVPPDVLGVGARSGAGAGAGVGASAGASAGVGVGAGFSEKLLLLPHSYQSNSLPADTPVCSFDPQDTTCRSRLLRSVEWKPRVHGPTTVGVGVAHILLCSFNANKKLEPTAVQVILRTACNSVCKCAVVCSSVS